MADVNIGAEQIGGNPPELAPAERGPEGQHHADAETHHVPPAVYYQNFTALMVLLILTVGVAELQLGPWNVFVAVLVAVIKAFLIILYFMHVRFSSRLVWVFASAAFAFVAIMFGLTLSDYFTRDWLAQGGK